MARASPPVASGQCLLTPGRVTFDSGRSRGPLLGSAAGHLPGGEQLPALGTPGRHGARSGSEHATGGKAGLAPLLPAPRYRGSAQGIPRAPRAAGPGAAVAAGTAVGTAGGAAGEPRPCRRGSKPPRDPGQRTSETRAPARAGGRRLGPPLRTPSLSPEPPGARPGAHPAGSPAAPSAATRGGFGHPKAGGEREGEPR